MYCKSSNKVIIGVDETGRGCEKPDCQVLTNNGWKFYREINLIEDKVLSYTNNGYIKWQKIEKIIEKDFEGNLIELKNRGIDIVVTPEHYFTVLKRVFKRDKKDNNRLKLVGYKARKERKIVTELVDNDFIPRGGKWKVINKEFFKLPKVDKKNEEKLIDSKLWTAFLGIFLAEGSTSYGNRKGMYRVFISQNTNAPQNKYKEIYSLLKKLPFKFNRDKAGFKSYNKQLYTYLKQFGDCSTNFIPKDIKELPRPLLNILINWMILGDGVCYAGKNRKEVCEYYTVSKKLKDDFEEILLKAGWTYHTSTRMPKDRHIGKRLIKKENQVPCFEIRLRRNNKAIVKHLHKKNMFYKGKVFCLQLPEYHNFYVRRNGTGYFTGNSLSGPVVAAAVFLKCKNQKVPLIHIAKCKRKLQNLKLLRDSKKLSFRQREQVYKILKSSPEVEWGIGRVSEKVIDKINIFQATKLAMRRAIKNLQKKIGQPVDFLLIDGNFTLELPISQKSIIRGDEKVFLIKLASVLAKVTRDRAMLRYHRKYPQYRLDQHKGYGTKLHFRMLKEYGPCKIHRRTFNPVKKYCQTQQDMLS